MFEYFIPRVLAQDERAVRLTEIRLVPIVHVKCWKVAHWNAKKLLHNEQKSKTLLQKFQKLQPKFLEVLYECLLKVLIFVLHNNS